MTQDVILETRSLSKELKGFVAVNDVNLKVRRGTISRGVVGELGHRLKKPL
jgi:ABC-type branched-subunit amino acid transport system ATPase component